MTLAEYIKNYRLGIPALTYKEAKIIGFSYPMKKGWFKKNMLLEIANPEALIDCLKNRNTVRKALRGNTSKPKKKEKVVEKAVYVKPVFIANSDPFLSSFEWRKLRLKALKIHGAKCQCCGATPGSGAVMNVDHIKPRKKFPELALDINNLQILCADCNHGKGNWDQTDFRK